MKKYLICFFILISFNSCQTKKMEMPRLFEFDLHWIALKNKSACRIEKSSRFGKDVMVFQPSASNDSVIISGVGSKVDWSRSKYLVCEVYNPNDCDATLGFNFFKRTTSTAGKVLDNKIESPVISPQIGFLPYIRTRLVLPLSVLDGQSISVERMPGQLTSFILGSRLDPNEVGEVHLRLSTPFRLPYQPKIEIASMYMTNELPDKFSELDKPVVDKFGQWNYKDWPGKIKDETQLKNNILALEKDAINSQYPAEWSQYGGWKQKRFNATGYFRTQFDGKRWWLADPEGYAYVSNGIDVITPSMLTQVYKNKNEDFFEWVPSGGDTSTYKDAISKGRNNTRVEMQHAASYGYNFYVSNLIRVFGQDWRKHWEEMTVNLIKKWRINSIANWSDIDLAKKSKVPYVIPLRGFPSTKTLLYRDFPDVYSEEYQNNAVQFAKQLESYKNDRYLVGYFLSNEPKWAFTPKVMAYDESFNLAFEMFGNPQPSFTKKAFIDWLKDRYKNSPEEFNKAWNLQLKDFDALETTVFKDRTSLTSTSENEMKEFSRLMADKYIKVVCDEVKKVDPNHLNLGMRYAWISNEYLYVAGAYFDVFSINGYFFSPPEVTAEICKRSGKPVMIGEFHFGSIDRGLPHPGLRGVANQAARGDAYSYYMEQGFARPEIVGLNFFEWLDEPVNGRYDGENFNIGVMDVCYQPYKELTDAIKTTNERLYKVADGQMKPFDKAVDQTY